MTKSAKEQIVEIIKDSKWYTSEVQADFTPEEIMEKRLFIEDEPEEQLEGLLKHEKRQEKYSYRKVQNIYFEKFKDDYNQENGTNIHTLNNFWVNTILCYPWIDMGENWKKREESLVPFKEFLEKNPEASEEEIRKELQNYVTGKTEKRSYHSEDGTRAREYEDEIGDCMGIDRAVKLANNYIKFNKIVGETLEMSMEEFAQELSHAYNPRHPEKGIDPVESARLSSNVTIKLFKVYEKLAEQIGEKEADSYSA